MEYLAYEADLLTDIQERNLLLIRERRLIRDRELAFDLSDNRFIELFRLNKVLAQTLIDDLTPHLNEPVRSTGISVELKVLSTLRFYATGNYQRGTGQDICCGLSQTMMSRVINEVTEAIYNHVASKWIKFPVTEEEKLANKMKFHEKTGFAGVIGAVDGTHVYIHKPEFEEWNFVNRKGFHTINTQIICNYDLEILSVNSRFPGSTHDSAIWNTSIIRTELMARHRVGDRTFWLLGDSGYPIEPWLMTPILRPNLDSEKLYNERHIAARNCVERCIGVLKQRFRCLARERVLRYTPSKVSKIIVVCCALHNMCISSQINLIDTEGTAADDDNDNNIHDEVEVNNRTVHDVGERTRNIIIENQFT